MLQSRHVDARPVQPEVLSNRSKFRNAQFAQSQHEYCSLRHAPARRIGQVEDRDRFPFPCSLHRCANGAAALAEQFYGRKCQTLVFTERPQSQRDSRFLEAANPAMLPLFDQNPSSDDERKANDEGLWSTHGVSRPSMEWGHETPKRNG